MSNFDNFQLQNDFITLTRPTCCIHNIYTIKRSSILSVEKTKKFSLNWFIIGVILLLNGEYNALAAFGIVVLAYQFVAMFVTVMVIRISGHDYYSFYCGNNEFDRLNQWFLSQQNIQLDTQPMLVN
jgi:hypothetical protein